MSIGIFKFLKWVPVVRKFRLDICLTPVSSVLEVDLEVGADICLTPVSSILETDLAVGASLSYAAFASRSAICVLI